MATRQSTAKSAAERKKEERARHQRAGRAPLGVYVHPEDRARVRRYVDRINKERFGDDGRAA